MKICRTLAALLTTCATLAHAAPAPYMTMDHSNPALIDPAAARSLWSEQLPAKLNRLYPPAKWGFASQVSGGFTDTRVCVVTATAMLLPRSGKTLVYRPVRSSSAFAEQAGASADQCRALAQSKLGEAIGSVRSSLLAE